MTASGGPGRRADTALCWIDVRGLGGMRSAVIQEAVHQRADAIVSDDPADLAGLPPTVTRVLLARPGPVPDDLTGVDVLVVEEDTGPAARARPGVAVGRFVDVVDAPTLERACDAARGEPWTVLRFRDPTKIPLEIVIAAAADATGRMITVVADAAEAEVVLGVLEHGPDGVLLAPSAVGDVTALMALVHGSGPDLELVELQVVSTAHVGTGERACVDTCTHLRPDEGILVGSHSRGMMLCVSETHPLPYMPTRPFRVNAGAIHSYTVGSDGRTSYLSELRTGGRVTAVDVKGRTRQVTVGRVKIETRPLISIDARADDGTTVNLILQDDWHVRVLGPGGAVLNSTELVPEDRVLGHLPVAARHVGYPITEFCLEQ